ncbi:MAG: DUF4435 domain-containing protein [Clostridia bacterium]|nr:DUF4435 domain-containing protein [Clostridia bacterium]
MEYSYWLPDKDGKGQEHKTNTNSVIIIGANGSGKSRLGIWLEHLIKENAHRIGAQRDLRFNDEVAPKKYSEIKNTVFNSKKKVSIFYNKYSETTKLFSDYDDVLSTLAAKDQKEKEDFFNECKKAEENGGEMPTVPNLTVDTLLQIWRRIFSHPYLVFEDSKFYAGYDIDGEYKHYSAKMMSDGEREALYLIAAVLCAPEGKTLIIDEPELHLHRSVVNQLWEALEQARPDCLFVYFTHDTFFAASHSHSDKIWIQNYDGKHWTKKLIENNDLPDELLLNILGGRKPVLFVEGDSDSYDFQLYSELYPSYYVIPCGSCTQVIQQTKAFQKNKTLHEYDVYGLIDRDYRSDYEIEQHKKDHIFTLQVAEVENLFIVEELIRFMAVHIGKNADAVFSEIKKYVIADRYANQIHKQILQSVVAEIKYKLTCAEISKKDETEAKASLENLYSDIEYDKIRNTQITRFTAPLDSNDYLEIIKVFNEKNISNSIGHFLGITDKEYCSIVMSLLKGAKHDEIAEAISRYLPPEIPR